MVPGEAFCTLVFVSLKYKVWWQQF